MTRACSNRLSFPLFFFAFQDFFHCSITSVVETAMESVTSSSTQSSTSFFSSSYLISSLRPPRRSPTSLLSTSSSPRPCVQGKSSFSSGSMISSPMNASSMYFSSRSLRALFKSVQKSRNQPQARLSSQTCLCICSPISTKWKRPPTQSCMRIRRASL